MAGNQASEAPQTKHGGEGSLLGVIGDEVRPQQLGPLRCRSCHSPSLFCAGHCYRLPAGWCGQHRHAQEQELLGRHRQCVCCGASGALACGSQAQGRALCRDACAASGGHIQGLHEPRRPGDHPHKPARECIDSPAHATAPDTLRLSVCADCQHDQAPVERLRQGLFCCWPSML